MTLLEILSHGICKNMEKTVRSIYHRKGETIHFLIHVKSVETCIIVKQSNGNQNIMVVHNYGFPSPSASYYVFKHTFEIIRKMLSML